MWDPKDGRLSSEAGFTGSPLSSHTPLPMEILSVCGLPKAARLAGFAPVHSLFYLRVNSALILLDLEARLSQDPPTCLKTEDWSLLFSLSKLNRSFGMIYRSYPARSSVVSTWLVSSVVVGEQVPKHTDVTHELGEVVQRGFHCLICRSGVG